MLFFALVFVSRAEEAGRRAPERRVRPATDDIFQMWPRARSLVPLTPPAHTHTHTPPSPSWIINNAFIYHQNLFLKLGTTALQRQETFWYVWFSENIGGFYAKRPARLERWRMNIFAWRKIIRWEKRLIIKERKKSEWAVVAFNPSYI